MFPVFFMRNIRLAYIQFSQTQKIITCWWIFIFSSVQQLDEKSSHPFAFQYYSLTWLDNSSSRPIRNDQSAICQIALPGSECVAAAWRPGRRAAGTEAPQNGACCWGSPQGWGSRWMPSSLWSCWAPQSGRRWLCQALVVPGGTMRWDANT